MRQEERSSTTQATLIQGGKRAFLENGYAGTSTPSLAKATGVSRGALYHHYADKKALFRAVVENIQTEVFNAIEERAVAAKDPIEGLKLGSRAFLEEASKPEFVRIVMVEGPAVLGLEEWRAIERKTGVQSLIEGLAYAVEQNAIDVPSVEIMAGLLSGALNESILTIYADDAPLDDVYNNVCRLIDGLAKHP